MRHSLHLALRAAWVPLGIASLVIGASAAIAAGAGAAPPPGPAVRTTSAPAGAPSAPTRFAADGLAPAPAAAAAASVPGTGKPAAAAAAGAVSVRVYTIRFRNPGDVAQLIAPLLSERGSITTGPPKLRTLTVQDRADVLARIGEAIASYDLPPRNVQFTITLIMASRNDEAGQSISKQVRGISEALLDLPRWTDYKTLDSVTIAGSEGSKTARALADTYRVEFDLESVSENRGVIRLNPFSLQKIEKGPSGEPVYTPVYSTTVNLTNDKLLTIGATKSETSPRALFLAIRARIEKP